MEVKFAVGAEGSVGVEALVSGARRVGCLWGRSGVSRAACTEQSTTGTAAREATAGIVAASKQ